MPWVTPSLAQIRSTTRANVLAGLRAASMIPNSVTRVVSDAMSGLAWLCLLYVDWLALQLLPDTAETIWLDRHANIWLVNSDGTIGRKAATFAQGTVTATGTAGAPVPAGTIISDTLSNQYQTTAAVTIGSGPTSLSVLATTSGAAGNQAAGTTLGFQAAIPNVNGNVTVVAISGGTDQENDDDLRTRVLMRIQQPPMGGDDSDYVQWTLAVPGVTRAWASPQEMGIGTMTVRFMMDELRAGTAGFPLSSDVAAVAAYLNTVRPVTVLDLYVEAPVPQPINFGVTGMVPDDIGTQAAVAANVVTMLTLKAAPQSSTDGITVPATTIYAAWVSDAILNTAGVVSFDLVMTDAVMPGPGSLAQLGNISWG